MPHPEPTEHPDDWIEQNTEHGMSPERQATAYETCRDGFAGLMEEEFGDRPGEAHQYGATIMLVDSDGNNIAKLTQTEKGDHFGRRMKILEYGTPEGNTEYFLGGRYVYRSKDAQRAPAGAEKLGDMFDRVQKIGDETMPIHGEPLRIVTYEVKPRE